MNRRSALAWLSGLLATASTLLIAVPGVSFFFSGVLRRKSRPGIVQRVARLSDLPVGKPVQVGVLGSRRDAWTLYPEEVIGRVWLLRSESADAEQSQVRALAAVCPHLGCAVQLDAGNEQFVCPCHRAAFALSGQRVAVRGRSSHAPRDLDALECSVVRDEATGEAWVEVHYQTFEQGLTKKIAQS